MDRRPDGDRPAPELAPGPAAEPATGPAPEPAGDSWTSLSSPARLEALRKAGLSAETDEGMERFARLVAGRLRVPVALVSLVEADRQVFPGLVGLAEPWATRRQTPLSHSLCQHVVATGHPLVLADARSDDRTCTSLAIGDLGVVAYAGMPLTDSDGHVLGSLCAIDTEPRQWPDQELADLADLTEACSTELRLRIATYVARHAQRQAEVAQNAAEHANAEARTYAGQARLALERSELMLRAAEDMADTASLTDVREKLRDLVSGELKPAYVGLALLEGRELRRIPDPAACYPVEMMTPVFSLFGNWPSSLAVRERRTVVVPDRDALLAQFGPEATAAFEAGDLSSAVCVPLPGTSRVQGVLILGWDRPHLADVTERAVLTAIAGYTALAVERALYLDERITVAHQLQNAMLSELPGQPGLQLAALYRPAAISDLVGGDWFDAHPFTRPVTVAGTAQLPYPIALTVGDITGHDMRAATIMGQVRSMLRQADLDLHQQGPAQILTAVEDASYTLSLDATGTLIHAHLSPLDSASHDSASRDSASNDKASNDKASSSSDGSSSDGSWCLTWTNAGHPPMLLAGPGGHVERLAEHGVLMWPDLKRLLRTDQQRTLLPGSTLLLYTDGLIEQRGRSLDDAIDRAAAILSASSAEQPLPDLVRQLTNEIASPRADDDLALLAVRIVAPD
jgi:serine phosphatase RsbU (regulator of sigma subunit)